MSSIVLHTWFLFKQAVRMPAFILFTAVVPSLFYYFFAKNSIQNSEMANIILASFVGFSFITAIFLQFCVQISLEMGSSWQLFCQSLPSREWQRHLARVIVTLVFSVIASLVLLFVVKKTAEPDLSVAEVLSLLAAVSLSSIPFFFLAYLLGRFVSKQSAMPVANASYLILSLIGGLLIPPSGLPEAIRNLSAFIPTRYMAEIAWSVVERTELNMSWVGGLVSYSLIFLVLIVVFKKKNLI